MTGLDEEVFRKTCSMDSKCRSTGGKRQLGPRIVGEEEPMEERASRLLCTISPSPTPGGEGANVESGERVAGEKEGGELGA